MTSGPIVLILTLLSLHPVQQPAAASDDKAAIVQAVLDYAEGYYGGEPARMTRAVSPYLSKREAQLRPTGTVIGEMNADTLIDYSYGVKLAPDARKMTTEVLDVGPDTASARVFSVQFNDYVHLIKRDGAWKIVNVLWHAPPKEAPADQTAAVTEVVRSFASGLTAAPGANAMATLHPLAHVRTLAAGRQGRARTVVDQNAEALIAALARGGSRLAGTADEFKITVESIDNDIAAARILAGTTRMHLHLMRADGQWRVVTVLRCAEAPPSAPAK